ncbi:MAG: sigma-70 family RNA polymerase sigma factor [Candidatus Omnitrophica bacterium]|nr:sigma-70 family RNA polymerase sigma factor [Candidatus Omnitrophota bacterium]
MAEDDSLAHYIKQLRKITLFTPTQEKEYFLRLKGGETKYRNLIYETFLPLVLTTAKEYCGKGVPFPDLIQEGNISLSKAIDNFDPAKGFRFSTYAKKYIGSDILTLFKKDRLVRIPDRRLRQILQYRKAEEELEKELCRLPTIEEIAEHMDESITVVSKIQKAIATEEDIEGLERPNDTKILSTIQKHNLGESDIIKKADITSLGESGANILKELVEKGILVNYSPTEVRFARDSQGFDDNLKVVREIIEKYAKNNKEYDEILFAFFRPYLTKNTYSQADYSDQFWGKDFFNSTERICMATACRMFESVFTKESFVKHFPNGEEIFNWLWEKGRIADVEELCYPPVIAKSKICEIGPNGPKILDDFLNEFVVTKADSPTDVILQPLNWCEEKARRIAKEDFDKIWAIFKQAQPKSREYVGGSITEFQRELLIKTYPNEVGRIIELIWNDSKDFSRPRGLSELADVMKMPKTVIKKTLKKASQKIELLIKQCIDNTEISDIGPDGAKILDDLIKNDVVEACFQGTFILRPALGRKKRLVREIAKEDFHKVWAVLQRAHTKKQTKKPKKRIT